MTKLPMSAAAAGLLRSVLSRAGADRNRILLIEARSSEWQSLTFVGERHRFWLRVPEPNAEEIVAKLTSGIEDAEFAIPGQIVADVGVDGPLRHEADGSIVIGLEALTIAE